MGKTATEVIMTLLKWGIVSSKNQLLSQDVVGRLAEHYQIPVIRAVDKKEKEVETARHLVYQGEKSERLPVIVVIGHVDHGKTSLLDVIRKTRVALKEKGGITQHLGAYEVRTPQGGLVFLDTPGHEAFSKIRMRGIKVADIAVLVVAADDSVMPQTIEAIKFAKTMEVPVIVAVNKIDKVDISRLDVVKRDLAQHDLLPEDWGGPTVVVPLSAKEGRGIDQLLEMLVLQSQMMELGADLTVAPCGYVLESRLEKGRGPVATVITKHGVLKVGDYFVAGSTAGHITSMVDSYGNRVLQVAPSIPVQVAGFSELPEAGDYFEVVSEERYRKARADKSRLKPVMRAFTPDKSINVMIKADTNSSKEAIVGAIEKLSKGLEKGFRVISSAVGDITESDIDLAANTGSMILGFTVKAEPNAIVLAHRDGVKIQHFSIIYQMLDSVQEIANNAKEVKVISTKIGEAEVRKIFDIKELGVIAGSYVKDGRFSRDGRVIVLRGPRKVGEGKIKSLQRDKKGVKEVHSGFECAFLIDGFNAWEIGDRVECYLDIPETKKTN